jgi:2-methylaconitate cis-trans-isomerase PrpF
VIYAAIHSLSVHARRHLARPIFSRQRLPKDVAQRDALLLAVMGSPDARQIDGLGGADP